MLAAVGGGLIGRCVTSPAEAAEAAANGANFVALMVGMPFYTAQTLGSEVS